MHRHTTSLGTAALSARTYTYRKSVRSESASPLCRPATLCFIHAIGDELMSGRAFVAIISGVPAPTQVRGREYVAVARARADDVYAPHLECVVAQTQARRAHVVHVRVVVARHPGANAGERVLLLLDTLTTMSRIPLPLLPPPPVGGLLRRGGEEARR